MEIQSAFNAGVQGFQQAVETANTAALNIARATASDNNFQEESAISAETSQQDSTLNSDSTDYTSVENTQDIPDLNQSIVELKVAEYQAKASAEVIKTADENLGTLLDVTA